MDKHCTCKVFRRCVAACVFSIYGHGRESLDRLNMDTAFLPCVFSYVILSEVIERRSMGRDCIYRAFRQCEHEGEFLNCCFENMQLDNFHI